FKHSAQRLQDSTFQVRVVFFVQDFDQAGDAHAKADRSVCVTKEIPGESIVFAELRNQDGSAERTKNVDTSKKIRVIKLAVGAQILERHFHEHHYLVFRTIAVLQKNASRAIQHIVGGVRHRSKTPALYQDRPLVKNFRGLNGLAIRLEHHCICQTLAD